MKDVINQAIMGAYLKINLASDSEDELKAKNLMIKQKTEELSTTLMEEARSISNLIKSMEEQHGPNLEPSNMFRVFSYLRLSIVDLHTLNYYLAEEKNENRQKFLLRSIALAIFELSEDVHHILGKNFRHSLRHFPNQAEIISELDKVGKEFNKFEKEYLSDIKEIRNVTIAHRDKNPVKQIETLDKLNLITA